MMGTRLEDDVAALKKMSKGGSSSPSGFGSSPADERAALAFRIEKKRVLRACLDKLTK